MAEVFRASSPFSSVSSLRQVVQQFVLYAPTNLSVCERKKNHYIENEKLLSRYKVEASSLFRGRICSSPPKIISAFWPPDQGRFATWRCFRLMRNANTAQMTNPPRSPAKHNAQDQENRATTIDIHAKGAGHTEVESLPTFDGGVARDSNILQAKAPSLREQKDTSALRKLLQQRREQDRISKDEISDPDNSSDS